MAVTGIIRISNLLPEFLANALILLCPLQPAWAISTRSFQSFPDGLHHFFILIQPYCHALTSFRFYYSILFLNVKFRFMELFSHRCHCEEHHRCDVAISSKPQ